MKVSKEAINYEARLSDVLRTVRDVVRRRLLVLMAVAATVTIIGVAITMQLTPRYEGVTRIQIDPSRNPLAKSANDAQAQLASEAIETEVSVINSLELARTVVRRLKLENDPEFNAGLQQKEGDVALTPAQKLDIVSRELLSHVSVGREKLTYIIAIRVNSLDGERAARIANDYATAYLDTRVGSKIGTAERQFAWFQKRLDELAKEARAADQEVAEYQSKAGIVKGGNNQQNTIIDQQVGPVAMQLAMAEAATAQAESQLAQAQANLKSGKVDSVPGVLASSTIADFRRQRGEIVRVLGEIEGRYGPLHPETIKVRDQLAQIDRQISDQTQRVMQSLQANAQASRQQLTALQGSMKALEGQQSADVRAAVISASLQRDADSKHAAYDRMAQLAFETRQASQNSLAQAQVIDSAEPARIPYWPNKPLFALLSAILGVGAGIAVITTQELMVSGMRSIEDLETELGIPLLGAIPAMKKNSRPADLLIDKPTSQFAEALRNARASIMGVKSDESPKIIALTSALPSEGKTTTALALARTMAMHGAKTLLLDVDIRRAQMRNIVRQAATGPGTVELLKGEATIAEAVERTEFDLLDQIVVNKPYFSSENLFATDSVHDLLDELSKLYDVIILDLPPLLGLADGRFLAAIADAVVLVVKWDATPAHAVSTALGSLQADGSKVIGALYAMVDNSSESIGSYYYYSKKYSSYYSDQK